MSKSIKIEHHVNKSFQEGQYCGSVSEIVITLPPKECRRLNRAMGLHSINWPSRKRKAILKAPRVTKNTLQQLDANNKGVQVPEEELDKVFVEEVTDDLASSSSELTPEQTARYTQYYRQFRANLECRLDREAQAEFARIRHHAKLMAKLNDK